jgi:hypothetical protein
LGATDFNEALGLSCSFNRIDCARLMVKSGATDLNTGLKWACSHGHVDGALVMVGLGATSCEHCGGANHLFK